MDKIKLRKLSHLSGEDYYYMTYLIILCLDGFAAKTSRVFKDHRKLSYLIQIISDEKIADIIEGSIESTIENPRDRSLLYSSYSKGATHSKDVYKLILTLELKGFVEVIKTISPEIIDVKINNKNIPQDFFNKAVFEKELNSITKIKNIHKTIARVGLKTFVEKLYTDKGLRVWVQ